MQQTYTQQEITKALEAFTQVHGISFDIVKFLDILGKVAARQISVIGDPMENNLCDSCQ